MDSKNLSLSKILFKGSKKIVTIDKIKAIIYFDALNDEKKAFKFIQKVKCSS